MLLTGYVSPEILRKDPYGTKTDIWYVFNGIELKLCYDTVPFSYQQ